MNQEFRKVEALCKRALEGTLGLKEFYSEWPSGSECSEFWQLVRQDIEDGVEHTPGTWFAGKVDMSEWQASWEYFVIYLDMLLVGSGRPPDDLRQLRAEILAARRMSLRDLEILLADRLKA